MSDPACPPTVPIPPSDAPPPVGPTFSYDDAGVLGADGLSMADVAARHGTPLYVYSLPRILAHYDRIAAAFAGVETLMAYSVKANSNQAILKAMVRRGSGFDIVSGGELHRVEAVGARPETVIFAGVGKSTDEIALALRFGVGAFNLESPGEAERIDAEAAARGVVAPVALRLNPDVNPHTHEYISTGLKENKFGINLEMADGIVERIVSLPNLRLVGLHAHIGSQILDIEAHARAVKRLADYAQGLRARGIALETLNMGGGFGIDYRTGASPLAIEQVAERVVPLVKQAGLRLVLEPGRHIVAPAGALLTRVLYVKHGSAKTFVIVDASMTELIRPALYQAEHRIVPVVTKGSGADAPKGRIVDIVGPVCESGDFLARERYLPPVEPGDLLAVLDAGGYGMVMASNYNTRPRPAEVLLSDGADHVVRARESVADLLAADRIPAFLND